MRYIARTWVDMGGGLIEGPSLTADDLWRLAEVVVQVYESLYMEQGWDFCTSDGDKSISIRKGRRYHVFKIFPVVCDASTAAEQTRRANQEFVMKCVLAIKRLSQRP